MPIYMKITDPNGAPLFTGSIKGRQNWLEADSAQLDPKKIVTGATSGRRETDRDTISEIVVTRLMDNNSPKLQQYAAEGKLLGCVIDFVKSDTGRTYLSITLKNVMISSYSVGGAAHGGKPHETLTFNFDGISFTHTPEEEATAAAVKLKFDAYRQVGVR